MSANYRVRVASDPGGAVRAAGGRVAEQSAPAATAGETGGGAATRAVLQQVVEAAMGRSRARWGALVAPDLTLDATGAGFAATLEPDALAAALAGRDHVAGGPADLGLGAACAGTARPDWLDGN